ncbi:hypothetical protein ACAG26_25000 [Mycobacterium sp. pUA109]|uniref:hypothetical protein n=1 Tax=Mycobacterium sp. pUA109 TaxID=3238982 RepID=UPI00351B099E
MTTSPAPGAVRGAGAIVAAEGVLGLVVAAVLVVRGLGGADQRVVGGVSLAICFALVGGGVLAAGWALLRGRRWGRGVAVFANVLLVPVTWYVAVGSHRWGYGIPIGVLVLAVLALLFSPAALRWVADR